MKNTLLLLIVTYSLAISCSDKVNKKTQEDKPVFDAYKRTSSDSASTKVLNNASAIIQIEEPEVPQELKPFIPKGYIAYDFREGDINKDGLGDYILLLGIELPKNELGGVDSDFTEALNEEEKLNVKLIIRKKNKQLYVHSSNNDFMDYAESISGQPDEITIDSLGNGFLVTYYARGMGGLGINSQMDYYFKYNKKADQWYLTKSVDETKFNNPDMAADITIEQHKGENPNYTQMQLDSLDKAIREQSYNIDVVVETPKDFGKKSFKDFKKSQLFME